MGQTLLTGAISCIITLTITFIFNFIVNKPKKDEDKRVKELEKLRKEFGEQLENINISIIGISEENKIQMEGIQAVIKNDLKVRYLECIRLKYAPMDAKDDLEWMYKVYHKLRANGVMDGLRSEFLALPETPPEKVRKNKSSIIDVEKESVDLWVNY